MFFHDTQYPLKKSDVSIISNKPNNKKISILVIWSRFDINIDKMINKGNIVIKYLGKEEKLPVNVGNRKAIKPYIK